MTHTRRVLRARTHKARFEHACDLCDELIFPGDLYEVTVTILSNGKVKILQIRKEHMHPQCPYDPDEEAKKYEYFEPVEISLAA